MRVHGVLRAAVESGQYEAPEWVTVDWPEAGVSLLVGAHALRAKSPLTGNMVRIPSSYRDAVAIQNQLGWIAPSSEVSDLIWRSATVRLQPHPMPTRGMDTMETAEAYDAFIERELSERPEGLTADEGKDWIVTSRNAFAVEGEPAATTYGWRYMNGQFIQGAGPPWKAPAHNADHVDYSQVLRPIQRYARRLGDPSADAVDLVDVYRARGIAEEVLLPFVGGKLGGGRGGGGVGGGSIGSKAPPISSSTAGVMGSSSSISGVAMVGLALAGLVWLRFRG